MTFDRAGEKNEVDAAIRGDFEPCIERTSNFRLGSERRRFITLLDLREGGPINPRRRRQRLHTHPALLSRDGDRAAEIDQWCDLIKSGTGFRIRQLLREEVIEITLVLHAAPPSIR